MDSKPCVHIKTDIGIDREFLKSRKAEVKNSFKCLGKEQIFSHLAERFVSDIDRVAKLCRIASAAKNRRCCSSDAVRGLYAPRLTIFLEGLAKKSPEVSE